MRESLLTIGRMLTFPDPGDRQQAPQGCARPYQDADARRAIAAGSFDLLATKLSYLQDATLGLINNEQNNIIKIMSVAAMVFLPPTLFASIWGMNFRFMPELHSQLGYPFAIVVMIISAVLPYLWFKRKGWL